jgi:PAS domain S-box-containing protein
MIADDSGKPTRMLGVVADVTDRELADRQLRKEKETAQMYFDTAGVFMLVLDTNRTIEMINRMGTDILGCAEDDIVGRDFLDFVPEASRNEAKRMVAEVTNEEIVPPEYFEVPTVSASGEENIIAWHSVAIRNEDGEIVGVLNSGRDVTEKRRAERAQQELENQLRYSQRMETIGTLAGGIAHDFNNILTPILGYTDIAIEESAQNSQIRDCLENVVKAAHRAKELVEQILLFSKNVDQDVSPIHLHLIVREGLKFVRASLPTTIEIQQNINIDSGVVLANSAQIHQVLVNLCTNAAYAMRDGGGILRVSLEPVEVDAELAQNHANLHPGSYARLTVSDTGQGMDQRTVERIFEPFFTTKNVGEGTGLGLPVVHGIVSGHGGEIVVDSERGKGTTVTVYLQREETNVSGEEVTAADAAGSERVLLVDDEPDIITVGRKMLERLGYEVTTATNGDKALEIVRRNPDGFDVVVTDQTMPRKTGLDLIQELRGIRGDLPVLLMTGFSDRITPGKLEELQVSELIMKPLEGKKVGAAIRRVLDDKLKSGEGS